MFSQVFCHLWFMHELAVDAAPDPLAPFGSYELAKIRVLAGIERTEAVSTFLAREVVAGIVFAIAFASRLYWLLGDFSDLAGIIGHQAISTKA